MKLLKINAKAWTDSKMEKYEKFTAKQETNQESWKSIKSSIYDSSEVIKIVYHRTGQNSHIFIFLDYILTISAQILQLLPIKYEK